MCTLLKSASMLLSGFFFLFMVGCSSDGGSAPPPETTALREVDMMLRTPLPRMGPKGPDLKMFQNDFPVGTQAAMSGDIVILWGAKMLDEGDKTKSLEIVAYEKKTPTEGGYVLTLSGDIKKMTPAEFEAAPKAGKK
jgi:hypothetical protein